MKTVTTLKRFASFLMVMFITSGLLNAQVITPPDTPDDLIDLPMSFNMDNTEIDWEGYTFFDFEGSELERIDNPDKTGLNETDKVLQYVKAGGQPWAGFFYHVDGEIELTDDSKFTLKVWSNRSDIRALLKLEMRNASDVNTGDLFADITASGEWVELEWDLSSVDRAPYDRVVIIIDLEGGSGDGSDDFIWYLDDFNFDALATSNELTGFDIPKSIQLNQNYPNPFNPSTNIEFTLTQNTHATLEVFDMLGQRVATLVNQVMPAGTHTARFDAANLSSGMYIYRLQAGNTILTRKLTLIK